MFLLEKNKVSLLIFLGIAVLTFWQLINISTYRPRALQPMIHIYMNPNSGALSAYATKTISVLMQPANSGNKIGSFDINFTTVGTIAVENVGLPSVQGTGNNSIFTPLIQTQTRASYTVNVPEAQWPAAVVLPVTIRGVNPGGQASLHVGIGATKITGNITGGTYDFGTVEQGNYTVQYVVPSATSTPRPTATSTPPPACSICLSQGKQFRCHNTLTGIIYCSLYNETSFEVNCNNCAGAPTPSRIPTPTQTKNPTSPRFPTLTPTRLPSYIPNCPTKTRGDADCNGVINLVDFEIWRKEAMGSLTSKNANFNSAIDSVVDIIDFEIWRKGFFSQGI